MPNILPITVSPEAYLSLLFQVIIGIRDRLDPKRSLHLKPLTLKAAKIELKNIQENIPEIPEITSGLNVVLNSKTIKESIEGLNSILEKLKKEHDELVNTTCPRMLVLF